MKQKLFGTDGIRATANTFPMTPDIVMKVGQALGYLIRSHPPRNQEPKVVIGKDTRLSRYMPTASPIASGRQCSPAISTTSCNCR